MKLKRAIGAGVLTCCLTVMGMVSFGGQHVEAAMKCDHKVLYVEVNVQKEVYHTSEGHYTVYGDRYYCPYCIYSNWQDVYTVKTGDHTFKKVNVGSSSSPVYQEICSSCGYKK